MTHAQSNTETLVDAIDALLAQTQCQECGYAACRPYAQAIAAGDTANKCRPGGDVTARALEVLLARPALPLALAPYPPQVAWIDPLRCIGCARCLPACPVDAIVGAQPLLHTVLGSECTGCRLCLAPCPVDCIEMRPRLPLQRPQSTTYLRGRYIAHEQRAADRDLATEVSRRERMANRRRNAPVAADTTAGTPDANSKPVA